MAHWPEYEAGLRRRLTPDALSGWQAPRRKTRCQHRYSDLAIETALTLGLVFGLRLRQGEGLLESVLQLMGLALAVPDHTTLSRRARTWRSPKEWRDHRGLSTGALHVLINSTGLPVYGAGQWLEEKHGARSPRGLRKLHLALDADSGEIVAHTLTDQDMPHERISDCANESSKTTAIRPARESAIASTVARLGRSSQQESAGLFVTTHTLPDGY
ncbi:putative transposase (plasmid) [Rhizobium favelukesii]|uniref:Transposase n=1 Tax=Rhizobium favelukesii TaxID=348824 RepID=W6RIX4_9HYPH|nr:putative transposase [Rhizobium favelukesii]